MGKARKDNIAELVKRCLEGDAGAWEALSRRVARIVFTVCHRNRLTRDEQFDIYGRVNEILLRKMDTIREPEKALSYVWTIAENEINALRRENSQTAIYEREIVDSLYGGRIKDPDEILREKALNAIIRDAMGELDLRCHDLIMALFFDPRNPSYQEISQGLKMPTSSIGPNRNRCLEKLVKILRKKGIIF